MDMINSFLTGDIRFDFENKIKPNKEYYSGLLGRELN